MTILTLNELPFSFVDRDMVMRYHWGLAVGHIYGHQLALQDSPTASYNTPNPDLIAEGPADGDDHDEEPIIPEPMVEYNDDREGASVNEEDEDHSELSDEFDSSEAEVGEEDDVELLEFETMYGDAQDLEVYD